MDDLKDRIVIITGASRGIGQATATKFAQLRAKVIITTQRDKAAVRESFNKDIEIYNMDVTAPKEVKEVFEKVYSGFGEIDILVNNAGIFTPQDFDKLTPKVFLETININLIGVFNCAQEILPFINKSGTGRIINISSVVADIGSSKAPHYAASKGAVNSFTKSLAKILAKDNITINAVSPSLVDTDMVKDFIYDKSNLEKKIPLGRIADPIDIANVVVFLASDAASYITGQIIRVNGGFDMSR